MRQWITGIAVLGLTACQPQVELDYLIIGGTVYSGENAAPQRVNVGIKDSRIAYVGEDITGFKPSNIINAEGLYVLPGFIDPHTHSISDLLSDDLKRRQNLNYQFQGVTTVVNGNDGFGDPDIPGQSQKLSELGIGTNTALFIGHGALRKQVMGSEKRVPSAAEREIMKSAIADGMEAGALGLSTGLFYAPGSFSDTAEIIDLAKVAAQYGGIYDSHIRDESTYNIGLIGAVDETLEIARQAGIPVNIAHIKALGVDVWGQSETIIDRIEAAQASGLKITADQYPWQASGTRISNALIPRWVKAGGPDIYHARLRDPNLAERIYKETQENLRKRGGPEAVLITASLSDTGQSWAGKTLKELADRAGLNPVEMALSIAREGDARIASFNMNQSDIDAFMSRDWVMTSSDGSTGHPRKYASFPKKYKTYVLDRKVISMESFVHRSTGLVADTFGICERGYLKTGFFADVAIIDPEAFAPIADFQNPAELSDGVEYLFVNGKLAINDGSPGTELHGRVLKRCAKKE